MHTFRFIILLSLSLLFSGCHKDLITTDIIEEVNPPDPIGTVNIEGIIKNIDGVILRNTEVSAHQNNKKVGTVYSNNDGYYTTKTLPIDPLLDVTLEYKKDNLDIKYRRFTIVNNEKIVANPLLGNAKQANVTQVEEALANPSDTNFVKLYGYTLLADGTPVRGVKCSAIWKYQTILFGNIIALWIESGSSDFSNENGYFEVLVPKGVELFFNTYYLRYPNETVGQCFLEFQNIQSNPLENLRFNMLGSFNEDHEVMLKKDIAIEINMVTIKGKALNCDGTPLVSGILRGYIGETLGNSPNGIILPGNSFVDFNYVFGPNGEFEFYLEGCKRDNKNYGISVNITSGEFEGGLQKYELVNSENFGNVNLCIDNRDFPDEFTLKLGDEPLKNYPHGGDNPSSGKDKLWTGFSLDYVGDLGESVYFQTENIALGIQPVVRLEMRKTQKTSDNTNQVYETTFKAKPEDVVLNITKIEDNYVYGTINGNVDTPQGNKSLDITFKIYNK